jgi:hypothetical protein
MHAATLCFSDDAFGHFAAGVCRQYWGWTQAIFKGSSFFGWSHDGLCLNI